MPWWISYHERNFTLTSPYHRYDLSSMLYIQIIFQMSSLLLRIPIWKSIYFLFNYMSLESSSIFKYFVFLTVFYIYAFFQPNSFQFIVYHSETISLIHFYFCILLIFSIFGKFLYLVAFFLNQFLPFQS